MKIHLTNHVRHWCGLGFLPILLALSACGCDKSNEIVQQQRSADANSPKLVGTALSPQRVLDESVAAYQRLESYQDKAYVRLQYEHNGKPSEDRAPLSIAWNRNGEIGIRAYSIKSCTEEDRFRLKVTDERSPVAGQIVSRALPNRLSFDWLLDDAIVRQQLAAGLAGFPLQLDLLLSPTPLRGLVGETAALSFGGRTSIDGRACLTLVVAHGSNAYKLFIDEASMLIRRLEFPSAALPPELKADEQIRNMRLTVELEDIRTNEPLVWNDYRIKERSTDRLVSHFVPVPLDTEATSHQLGVRVPAFQLRNPSGEVVYDSSNVAARKAATVFVWLADHPGCRVAAEQLNGIASALSHDPELSSQVALIPIWAEPQPPLDETFETLASSWKLPGALALDQHAIGRDIFQVTEAPTLIVIDADNRIQIREVTANPTQANYIPGLLKRLVEGENLAESHKAGADMAAARFEAELHMATAIDGLDGRAGDIPAYSPQVLRLKEQARLPHAPIVATTADAERMVWNLGQDGRLMRANLLSGDLHELKSYSTPWRPSTAGRLLVDSSIQYAALYTPANSSIQIYTLQSGENRRVQLGANVDVIDVGWLHLTGSQSSRLAILTSDNETVLLDPKNHEQLSGRCPHRPLALIANQHSSSSIHGFVVLANRSVEPLRLSNDSSHVSTGILGRPAAYKQELESNIKLQFEPAAGPWLSWRDADSEFTLARGWIAKDEPALFLVDDKLRPLWHRRIGLQPNESVRPSMQVAREPVTGKPTWLYADGDRTIHVLRADGVTDHFRVKQPFVGLTLAANGQSLVLGITHATETVLYDVTWTR